MRRKTMDVLCYLLERHGEVVSRDDLLRNVWAGTAVADAGITTCIGEIRNALADNRASPRFLHTVHGRGYRFTPEVRFEPDSPAVTMQGAPIAARDAELATLHARFERCRAGERQFVLLRGEAGIGKTTLANAFAAAVWAGGAQVAIGHCAQQYGAGEPLLPLFDALGALAASAPAALRRAFDQHAPAWLVHIPGLLDAGELAALNARLRSETPERMLRMMADALGALARERPLLLVFEDLHWSDPSTVSLLSILARREDPACLFVLGTARPVERNDSGLFLTRVVAELAVRGRCHEMALPLLDLDGIRTFLDLRFPGSEMPAGLAGALLERTEGNPLFLDLTIAQMVHRGWIEQGEAGWRLSVDIDTARAAIPDSLRQTIEGLLAELSASERLCLDAASVAGIEFPAHLIAAMVESTLEEAERALSGLARRRRIVEESGNEEWPDRRASTRYRFLHSAYRTVLADSLSPSRLRSLNAHAGDALDRGYAGHHTLVAERLAEHFIAAEQPARAYAYCRLAASSAAATQSFAEASEHWQRALDLLRRGSRTAQRDCEEVEVRVGLGTVLAALHGPAAPVAGEQFAAALALPEEARANLHGLLATAGLLTYHYARAEYRQASEECDRAAQAVCRMPLPPIFVAIPSVHRMNIQAYIGELEAAAELGESLLPVFGDWGNILDEAVRTSAYLADPRLIVCNTIGAARIVAGDTREGRRWLDERREMGRDSDHAMTGLVTIPVDCFVTALLTEMNPANASVLAGLAADMVRLCERHGLHIWRPMGEFWRVAVPLLRGERGFRLDELQAPLAQLAASGLHQSGSIYRYTIAFLAAHAGETEIARQQVEAARRFARDTGELIVEPLIAALEASLVAPSERREELFDAAAAVAAQRGEKLFELLVRCRHAEAFPASARAREYVQALLSDLEPRAEPADLLRAREILRGPA